MSNITLSSLSSIGNGRTLFSSLINLLGYRSGVTKARSTAASRAVVQSIATETSSPNLLKLYRLSANSDSVNPAVLSLLTR